MRSQKNTQLRKSFYLVPGQRGFYRTSDIDIALCGGGFPRFSLDVDEQTSTLLQYDIVNLDGAVSEELRDSIQKEGRILYEKI